MKITHGARRRRRFYAGRAFGLIPSLTRLTERCRAIEIQSGGEAYASLGLMKPNRMRWAEAEKLKRHAIKLNRIIRWRANGGRHRSLSGKDKQTKA